MLFWSQKSIKSTIVQIFLVPALTILSAFVCECIYSWNKSQIAVITQRNIIYAKQQTWKKKIVSKAAHQTLTEERKKKKMKWNEQNLYFKMYIWTGSVWYARKNRRRITNIMMPLHYAMDYDFSSSFFSFAFFSLLAQKKKNLFTLSRLVCRAMCICLISAPFYHRIMLLLCILFVLVTRFFHSFHFFTHLPFEYIFL